MSLDITLYPPNVCLSLSASYYDIGGGDDLIFGSVYKINVYSIGSVQVGDNVSFNRTDARLVTQGNGQYYIIDEEKLFFKEDVEPLL